MFRHQGKSRTHHHNLKIASLLSFVAGLVNVAGFLSVQRLTTNVTGHFAFVTDEVFKMNFKGALIFLLYILFFLAGSFVSNFIVEVISRKSERFIFTIPVLAESVILFVIAVTGDQLITTHPNVIACSLLFAMGLQNSLVTQISNSVVRTTHLTGLFTDLGIELSQLLFYKAKEQKTKLLSSIQLRLTIIFFFFSGGIAGGLFYSRLSLHVLLVAVAVLIAGLAYDTLKFRFIRLKRNLKG
ncbi:MAG: YoaK family protein [Chitinophagaceae bacterium]